ncbi:MAG TPA: hypothetical protein PLQ13_00095 [Candidatus Krumholzibacteria bacterium]|nr:hypothetical protein [Candidatus Krumholzibacteria bacterium]
MVRACVAAALVLLLGLPAAAAEVYGGWVHADLGLDEQGDGFLLGVGGTWPIGTGPFDVAMSGELLRKHAIQPLFVGSQDQGPVTADAEVSMTCLQATISAGWTLPVGGLGLRPYAGGGVSIKMSESWDRPAGEVAVDYGYEDVDVMVHLGLRVQTAGPIFLDGRWTRGLFDQVIVRDSSVTKVSGDAPTLPVNGDTVSWFHAAVGVAF